MKKRSYTKLTLLGLLFVLFSGTIYAQNVNEISGKVFPAGMQTPIKGVKVQVEGNMDAAVFTDENGSFKMDVPAFPVSLVLSIANYQQQIVVVKKASDISVFLMPPKTTNDYGKIVGVSVSLNPESRDGILMFSSTNNNFKYWFDNRVYLDGAAYFGDNTYQGDENKMGNGVGIRRMRFAMKTILWGHWGGEIDFDFADNEVDIKDAFVRYIGNNWQLKAGNFKEPFSMETTSTSRYLTFMERPYAVEQAPSRHLGISYRRFTNHVFFEGGLFSSVVRNELIKDQNKSNGTNAGWSATGRLAYAPIKKDLMTLHFGVAGSYRTPKIPELGDPIDSFRYGENAESEINRKKYIDTDWIEHCEYKTLLGMEAAFAYKNYKVQGEYIMTRIQRDKNEVPEGEDQVDLGGFYVMGAWLIKNADYYYNMREAEFNQINFRDNKKGAMEVALRYSYMDANSFVDGSDIPFVPGGAGESYTIAFNYYFNYNVRVSLNYAYLNHDRWANGKGMYKTDNLIPLPTGEAGIDFSTLQARIEIDF
jgi:phosphate-selective porin OprO and OprP